jgi:hypothetical protein
MPKVHRFLIVFPRIIIIDCSLVVVKIIVSKDNFLNALCCLMTLCLSLLSTNEIKIYK